jgi:hypothetical protein
MNGLHVCEINVEKKGSMTHMTTILKILKKTICQITTPKTEGSFMKITGSLIKRVLNRGWGGNPKV